MHKIWFNGKGYPDADAMPPDVRRLYDDALKRRHDADEERTPDLVRMGVWEDEGDGLLEVHTSREIVINGKKYSDLEHLPSEEKELVRKMMGRFPDLMGEIPDLEGIFKDGGLTEIFESGRSETRNGREDREVREVVFTGANRIQAPRRGDGPEPVSPWKNGWAVALVLAMALLWMLIFGG